MKDEHVRDDERMKIAQEYAADFFNDLRPVHNLHGNKLDANEFAHVIVQAIDEAFNSKHQLAITNDSSLWQRNDIQYPRLIAEIVAADALNKNVRRLICDSMDLQPEELAELCNRAEADWVQIKRSLLPTGNPPRTLRCPYCNYNGKKETENGHGFRYLSDQTTWREVVSLKRGVLLIEGQSEIYDEDAESHERLECRSCLGEFPIPPGLQTDFC